MDNYITILPTSTLNFNHIEKEFCLPEKSDCNYTTIDGILHYGDFWNCNKCATDKELYINVPRNGKIMIQTNYNTPREPVASDGWGAFINIALYDINDTLITSNYVDIASRYVVGHTGKYGYQTIEIDFSKFTTTCGYFVITVSGEDDVYTEQFKVDDCLELVELEATYTDYDCWGNYYQESVYGYYGNENFAYSNKIYLHGSSKYFGTDTADKTVTETLRFHPSNHIAPYMQRYIAFKVLSADTSLINGEEYDNKEASITPREGTSMFFPILEFERDECNSASKCVTN